MAFLISDPGILAALAALGAHPTVDIRGVYDPNGMNDALQYSRLDPSFFWFVRDPRFERAPSHPFNPHGEQDFMHNKTMVIDDHLVVTGSYNFSENAEANDENLLVIDSPGLAAACTTYFDALFDTYGQRSETPVASVAAVEHPGPRPHVLIADPAGRAARSDLWLARSREALQHQTERGRTDDLVVYTDGTDVGNAAADAVLATAADDVAAVRALFGGTALPAGQDGEDADTPRTALPLHVLIDPEAGGAYHFGCAATDLYIEPNPEMAVGLMVAELVEVYEAAVANGWDCGRTNGEALSRVLAAERDPKLAPLLASTERGWGAGGQMDRVSNIMADDRDQSANGCGTLFLYYLHTQLGYDWDRIVAAGGATLADTYQTLTGNPASQAFAGFLTLLVTSNFAGDLTVPASGNPFPLTGMSLFDARGAMEPPPAPTAPHLAQVPPPIPASRVRPPIPGPPIDGAGTVH